MEFTSNDFEQINFFDLPEINKLKDLSAVGLDIAVIVSLKEDPDGEKSELYFKTRHNIVNRAKELDAEFVRKRHFPVNRLDGSQYFIFSSKGRYKDTIPLYKNDTVEI